MEEFDNYQPSFAMKVIFWFFTAVMAVLGAVAVAAIVLHATEASAHQAPTGWSYPFACCANYDCKQEAKGDVLERPEGYVIAKTGEVIPMTDKRVRQSPDGEFHWCAHQSGLDAGKTICLFVPPRGF